MGRTGTSRRRRRAKPYRRHTSWKATNWGPFLALTGTVVGVLALIAVVVFVVLPKVMPLLGVDYSAPLAPTATPVPTPEPTPTPHPMESFDNAEAFKEVVFTDYTAYQWFGDPYFYDGVLLLSGGQLVDGNAVMGTLLYYYPEKREASVLPLKPQYTHFMFAKFNKDYLVYLDAKLDGGGAIMAVDLHKGSLQPVRIKDVYTGQPEVMLDGHYIAWTERTGTRMDKLFVCDLNTQETTTMAMFSNSVYGQSLPCLRNGRLTWADTSSGSGENSTIHSILLTSSTSHAYSPGTYAHDPQSDGVYTVWLDSHHAETGGLYYAKEEGAARKIADGVVQFGLGDGFVTYGKNEGIYAYVFDNDKTYRISTERESAMFLGCSDDRVVWMDVTSRERDIVKFAEIPH